MPVLAKNERISLSSAIFTPDATRAVIFSIIPGLGQFYNRKYWKLPIIYTGFLSCFYAVIWNNRQYNFYKNAYLDFIHLDPSSISRKSAFVNSLKNGQDYYRRYRDLSCIAMGGLYVLCMVDSYVDAQLFDFDINEDLSCRVKPVFLNTADSHLLVLGCQCRIYFN